MGASLLALAKSLYYILQSSSTKLIIGTALDMDFNSKVCGL